MDKVPQGASTLLRNLCAGYPPPSLSCLMPCLPTLSRLAFSSDHEISDDACFALLNLIKAHGPRLSITFDPTFLSKLLKFQRLVELFSTLKSVLFKSLPINLGNYISE